MLSSRSPSRANLLGGSRSGDGGLLSGSDLDGGGVDSAGLRDDLFGRGGGSLIIPAIGGLGGGIKTTFLSSGGQSVAVVAPDVKLESAVEAAVEELEPLGVVTVAIIGGATESET